MTTKSNPIIDVLASCQNGKLIDTLGAACDLSEAQCRQALERLTPDIARRIGERITDEETYEDLLDILDEEEQVEYLDDPNAMFSRHAVTDGEDVLELLYGSMAKAHAAAEKIGPPKGVANDVFARLMTMAAALTFAAMARRNQHYQLSAADKSVGDEPGESQGLIAMLISALVAGLAQGLKQATRPKRRRRRKRSVLEQILGTGTTRQRRKTTRRRTTRKRRRRKKPSLRDLIGDILD